MVGYYWIESNTISAVPVKDYSCILLRDSLFSASESNSRADLFSASENNSPADSLPVSGSNFPPELLPGVGSKYSIVPRVGTNFLPELVPGVGTNRSMLYWPSTEKESFFAIGRNAL